MPPQPSTTDSSTTDSSTTEPVDQRQSILAAAIEVLSTKGPARFTVRNVAEAAGCSTTGVYTWFGSKQGLADVIFYDAFERFDQFLLESFDYQVPTLIDAAVAYRRWALDNPTSYLVMFGRAIPEHIPSEGAMARALESFDVLVACTRNEMAPQAEPATDEIIELAFNLWTTMHGHVMLELTDMVPVDADRDQLYHRVVQRAISSLRT